VTLRFRLSAFLAAACLAGCLQGGGTDIGNALVRGKVTEGGIPVSGAEVILMPAAYNPVMGDPSGRTRSVLTGADGTFRFAEVAPGPIALEMRHPDGERMDWIRPVPLAAGESLEVASELEPARALTVRLPAGAPDDAYAFLPGTDAYGLREAGGETARLPHAPAGPLDAIGIGSLSVPAGVAYYSVSIGPADTAVDLRGASPSP
jgi:hypothetical protein